MAEVLLLGLFHEATSTADTIDQLRRLGLPDEMITVMSGMPYRPEMLGRPRPQRRLGRISLLGALAGCLLGLFLTVGIFLLYPLEQGGQPIVPVPPSLIILFEATNIRMFLFFFPSLFENFFLFYAAAQQFFPQYELTGRRLALWLAVLLVPKMVQEYFLHYQRALDDVVAVDVIKDISRAIIDWFRDRFRLLVDFSPPLPLAGR